MYYRVSNEGVPVILSEKKWCSRSSIAAKRTSTYKRNFSAIRIPSKYCPLLLCRSISEMQAALASSKADMTLPCNMTPSQISFDSDTRKVRLTSRYDAPVVPFLLACPSTTHVTPIAPLQDIQAGRPSPSQILGWSVSASQL